MLSYTPPPQTHATLAFELLRQVPGLRPVRPDGAMYMMIGIDTERFPEYENELAFVQDLVKEQSVFCLPGQCFDYPNYIRIVLTVPQEMIVEACGRIAEFCADHYQSEEAAKSEVLNNVGAAARLIESGEMALLNAVDC